MADKLYPPIISGTIPAFYSESMENGATSAKIVVPFSMNRAVSDNDIKGFQLKIKTVQSNTFIKDLKLTTDNPTNSEGVENVGSDALKTMIANKEIVFHWNNIEKIKIGQFLKIQLAYISKDNIIGYFSTVGIIKYTAKPTVTIKGYSTDEISVFRTKCTGVYEPNEQDKNERPYSYNFSLYDNENNLIETSGWLLHNNNINTDISESLSLDSTIDSYTFKTSIKQDANHYIQYSVRTINNLQVSSQLYTCAEAGVGKPTYPLEITAKNIFEEGYIDISFQLQEGYITLEQIEELIETYGLTYDTNTSQYEVYDKNNHIIYYITKDDKNFTIENGEHNIINSFIIAPPLSTEDSVSIEICRAEKTDNYSSWQIMQRLHFSSYNYALNDWSFKDFTIEQGVTYQYCFRQYNDANVESERIISNTVMADFEDMFLWDGKKQLKIRFNPKVSSFKVNRLESKMDTIGSRYPFIFRNGIVEYKEFPIAGLISYHLDNNELFTNHKEDLNILLGKYSDRLGTPGVQMDSDKPWELSETLDSVGYNMRAERRFKLKLLDWLGNGEIKLFRSPAEGNYLVRLLNVSLTPEDRLGRMLHSFTCTAYEVADFTYENLLDLNFFNQEDLIISKLDIKTIKIKDMLINANLSGLIKLNDANIYEYFYLGVPSGRAIGSDFYVNIGKSEHILISAARGLTVNSKDNELPDIYFSCEDNLKLLKDVYHYNIDNMSPTEKRNILIDLVGDTQLTYRYSNSAVVIGEFQNIKEAYLTNRVQTFIGPLSKNFAKTVNNNEQREILKFYILKFREKPIVELIEDNGKYKYKNDNMNENEVTVFDELSMYAIYNKNEDFQNYLYYKREGSVLTQKFASSINTNVSLTTSENETFSFNAETSIDLCQFLYNHIEMGNGVYLECAYQEKVIEYKEGES